MSNIRGFRGLGLFVVLAVFVLWQSPIQQAYSAVNRNDKTSLPNSILWTPIGTKIRIDIKPDDPLNKVNLYSKGIIPVAVYGTRAFAVTTLDLGTVTFAGAKIGQLSPSQQFNLSDINHDGIKDLILGFNISDLQLKQIDIQAILQGKTFDSKAVWGSDFILVMIPLPPQPKFPKSEANVSKSTVNLVWDPDDKFDSDVCYAIEVASDRNFKNKVDSGIVVAANSYTTVSLANGTYYWHVGMSDCSAKVVSPWSLSRSFTIEAVGPIGDLIIGPLTFTRTSGKPQTQSYSFSVSSLVNGPFTLVIENGSTNGKNRVSSSVVKLNGIEVINSSVFNRDFTHIERTVPIKDKNVLEIQLAGKPGEILKLSIYGHINPDATVSTITNTGGTVSSPKGIQVVIPQGALTDTIVIGLKDETAIPLSLPLGYELMGAFSLDLAGASFKIPAKVSIPVTPSKPGYVIASRVIGSGEDTRLVMVDTTSLNSSGYIQTNSAPFPGVLAEGTYTFVQIPEGLAVLGVHVTSETGQPVSDSYTQVITGGNISSDLYQGALDAQSVFIGLTDSTGFAGVPGVVPGSTVQVITSQVINGVLSAGLGGPENLLNFPGSNGYIDKLIDILLKNTGININVAPPPNFQCSSLDVLPNQIPLNTNTNFVPPDKLQLVALCGREDVASSTNFLNPAELAQSLLTGVSGHITFYSSRDPQIADVSPEGTVSAVSAGTTEITVQTFLINTHIHFGFVAQHAYGRVYPVTVGDLVHLTVDVTGQGTVVSNPTGIACLPTCQYDFQPNSLVTLTATAATGYALTGWGGACSGSSTTCVVTMDMAKSVTVQFSQTNYNLTVVADGYRIISNPPGINCGGGGVARSLACDYYFSAGTSVQLTYIDETGAYNEISPISFSWVGDCNGSAALTSITMTRDMSCGVSTNFDPNLVLTDIECNTSNEILRASGYAALGPNGQLRTINVGNNIYTDGTVFYPVPTQKHACTRNVLATSTCYFEVEGPGTMIDFHASAIYSGYGIGGDFSADCNTPLNTDILGFP